MISQVRVRGVKNQMPRTNSRWNNFVSGSKEGGQTPQLAPHPVNCERSMKHARGPRLPMTIHPSLHQHRTTPHSSHQEKHPLQLDHGMLHCPRYTDHCHHKRTHVGTTRHEPTILSASQCFSICDRSHPVTK